MDVSKREVKEKKRKKFHLTALSLQLFKFNAGVPGSKINTRELNAIKCSQVAGKLLRPQGPVKRK